MPLFGKKKQVESAPELKEIKESIAESPEPFSLPKLPEIKIQTFEPESSFEKLGSVPPERVYPFQKVPEKATMELSEESEMAMKKMPEISQKTKTKEMISEKPMIMDFERETTKTQFPLKEERPESKVQKEIFVRIDNFKIATHLLNEVYNKLSEAQKVFERIKENKIKEDTELNSWHSEMEDIKSKLNEIDSKLLREIE